MSDWRDISTAALGSRGAALCVDENGEEIVFEGIELIFDEVPYAFRYLEGAYWPHENGYTLTHWRPSHPCEGER